MAFTFGFYNSKNHDRMYDARQFCSIFDGIINDGVFESIGKQLTVKLKQNRTVLVQEGKAWFNHTWNDNDTPYELTIDNPDALYTRWDAIVLEVNTDDMVRANGLKVIKGTPASNPSKPTMKKTTSRFQYPLAYIQVIPGKTKLDGSDIQNVVGSPECPFVKAVTKMATLTDIYSQYEAQYRESLEKKTTEFENWFQTIQSNLSGDQAAKLWAYVMLTPSFKSLANKMGGLSDNSNVVDALTLIVNYITSQKIILDNITISSTSIENIDTSEGVSGYKYIIRIPITGCTDEYIPYVFFKKPEDFSNVAISHNGYINVFTNNNNFGVAEISKIILEKGVK
jgi:hypothetical protein